jgi:tRNA U38,U39,U40 pseudouridine synthase TruA
VATATAKGFQAGQTMSSAVRTEAVVHAIGQLP